MISYARCNHWKLAASFAVPSLTLAAAYVHHLRHWTQPMNYMPEFYFDRARDTLFGFLLRSLHQELNLFAPPAISSERLAVALAIALALVLIVALRAQELSAAFPVVVLFVLSGQVVVASLLGKHPFGGHLRHQFLLFPFLVLSLIAVAGGIQHDTARRATAAILALIIGINAIAAYRGLAVVRGPLFLNEMQKFRATALPSTLIYLDEFSTIAFFSHHPSWDWHLAGSDAVHTLRYQVKKNVHSMRIVRVRNQWNFQPLDDSFYRELRQTMDLHRAPSAALFALNTIPVNMPSQEAITRVTRAAAAQRLAVDRILVDRGNVYARLIPAP